MDAPTEATRSSEMQLTTAWINFPRYHVGRYLGGRRGLLILAVAVLGGGVAVNWSWLVAIGVAPLLVALAPCAAMCALGLCMNRLGGKSCSTQSASTDEKPGARTSSATGGDPHPTEPTVAASALIDERVSDMTPHSKLSYTRALNERKHRNGFRGPAERGFAAGKWCAFRLRSSQSAPGRGVTSPSSPAASPRFESRRCVSGGARTVQR